MGLQTFGINVTLDGCVDHREGTADDETHAFFTSPHGRGRGDAVGPCGASLLVVELLAERDQAAHAQRGERRDDAADHGPLVLEGRAQGDQHDRAFDVGRPGRLPSIARRAPARVVEHRTGVANVRWQMLRVEVEVRAGQDQELVDVEELVDDPGDGWE